MRSSSDSATTRSTALPRRREDDADLDGIDTAWAAVVDEAELLDIVRVRRSADGSHEKAWRGDMRGECVPVPTDVAEFGNGTHDVGERDEDAPWVVE